MWGIWGIHDFLYSVALIFPSVVALFAFVVDQLLFPVLFLAHYPGTRQMPRVQKY